MTALAKKDAHLWERHPEDYYIEPEWCSERLFAEEKFDGWIFDPACGSGRIVRAARSAGYAAGGADIVARSEECATVGSFLGAHADGAIANIVSNPPFKIADQFVEQALRVALGKVAMLLPTKWMSAAGRSRWLETTPLYRVWLLAPRPSMPPGPVIEAGIKPGNGTVDFAWFVWRRGYSGPPELRWLRRTV